MKQSNKLTIICLDKKNARIKELEDRMKEKEKESAALAEAQANDLRRALEQVFYKLIYY